jgi:hypothetical protein
MKITRISSNTERPTGTTCEHLTMATEVKTVAPKTMTAGASLKAVLIVLVGLASLLLVICVAAAVFRSMCHEKATGCRTSAPRSGAAPVPIRVGVTARGVCKEGSSWQLSPGSEPGCLP